MITQAHFQELLNDLFSEYLPKVKKAERREFVGALMDELEALEFEFEPPFEDEDDLFERLEDDED